MFETYEVPSLFLAVDSLMAYNGLSNQKRNSLIIDLGHQTTHIITLLDGKLQLPYTNRISVGGINSINIL